MSTAMTPVLTDTSLSQDANLTHGFFTRAGGVSEGAYATLNMSRSSGDIPENVAENRARAAEALGMDRHALVFVRQVHSADAVTVTDPIAWEDAPRADGMATSVPGLLLGILTADCAPVLFADASAGVVGAAHAGWRGALSGVTDATVAAMEKLGASRGRIGAAIGPCIGKASYEVGPGFPDPFLARDGDAIRFFTPARRADHFMFDLEGYVADRLQKAGLGYVGRLGCDTCADEDRFFSYRRATLNGDKTFGHGLSAIGLRE